MSSSARASDRPRCFVTRRLADGALERLGQHCALDVWPERLPPSPEVLRERVADADALLCMLTDRIDDELLAAAPRLRAIATFSVGFDHIDVAAATRRGVPVGNTPGVLTEATADLTFALLLALARRLPEASAKVHAGDWITWEPDVLVGRAVHGATLGIIGAGRIGLAVARRAEGFGMAVLTSGRSGPTPLDELLERSDFVTLHCPLTAETRHLIDARALALMKPTAGLINAARGPIVQHDDLLEALVSGQIGGAALDVTDPEPLPAGHPLLGAPNLLVVPHIASATGEVRAQMAALSIDNLLAALDGRPMPHPVAPPPGGSTHAGSGGGGQ